MVKRIIWRKTADKSFDNIAFYLNDTFSLQVAHGFAKLVYDKIDRLEKQPYSGAKVSGTKSIRYVNFGKHYQMFYRIEGATLIISYFFDTRQNPSKRPF